MEFPGSLTNLVGSKKKITQLAKNKGKIPKQQPWEEVEFHLEKKNTHLEPQTTIYKWMFQLDDSKSLYRKWLFHQTSIYKWLFGVPGTGFLFARPKRQSPSEDSTIALWFEIQSPATSWPPVVKRRGASRKPWLQGARSISLYMYMIGVTLHVYK